MSSRSNVLSTYDGEISVSREIHADRYDSITSKRKNTTPKRKNNFTKFINASQSDLVEWTDFRQRYWVDTPYHHFHFSESAANDPRRMALSWAAIMAETGLREEETDPDVVPIKVAALGKSYVAAYMYAIHEYSISEIANQLELSEDSVGQYIRDVIAQRR